MLIYICLLVNNSDIMLPLLLLLFRRHRSAACGSSPKSGCTGSAVGLGGARSFGNSVGTELPSSSPRLKKLPFSKRRYS